MPPQADHLILHETDEAENHTAVFIYSEPSDSSKHSPARVDISVRQHLSFVFRLSNMHCPRLRSRAGSYRCHFFPGLSFMDPPSDLVGCGPSGSSRSSRNGMSTSLGYLLTRFSPGFLQLYRRSAVVKGSSPRYECNASSHLISIYLTLAHTGIGVGNVDASPTNALLLHILQDTSGRIATILFAHRVGTALEPECKTYRLAADVFNDIAMIMDCLSPMVPAGVMRVSVLSAAGVLRALCGVAGGSSKASLSAHFAKWGNLAELNAKDSSQETVISLFGMLVGSVIVSHITGFMMTWAALLFLLASHLSLNYAAVRSVQMTSLNRQRASMVFSTIIESDNYAKKKAVNLAIPTPAQIALDERILAKGSPFFWVRNRSRQSLGSAEMGVSLAEFFARRRADIGKDTNTRAFHTNIPIKALKDLFEKEEYILYLTPQYQSQSQGQGHAECKWHASILLTPTSTTKTQLKAWCHALIVARALSEPAKPKSQPQSQPDLTDDAVLGYISETLNKLNEGRFEGYLSALGEKGWDVTLSALEVRAGRRVCLESR
ncbi:unnamed protein product [Penicillium manginii]